MHHPQTNPFKQIPLSQESLKDLALWLAKPECHLFLQLLADKATYLSMYVGADATNEVAKAFESADKPLTTPSRHATDAAKLRIAYDVLSTAHSEPWFQIAL